MLEFLESKDCPMVLDSLSAPMLGYSQRIIMLSMKLRNSHMRNLPETSQFTYGNKVIVMLNPEIAPEEFSEETWQYECNLVKANKIKGYQLVKRHNFINIKFASIWGDKHKMILPFRESRLV